MTFSTIRTGTRVKTSIRDLGRSVLPFNMSRRWTGSPDVHLLGIGTEFGTQYPVEDGLDSVEIEPFTPQ